MAKLTKRQQLIKDRVDSNKLYTIEEAVAILNDLPAAKFKESIDIAINLGVDPRKSDQVVRGATNLPAGTGKTKRVAVFAQGAAADAAKEAGADVVGFEDLADSIKAGNMDFDVVIASPDAMRVVGQLGTILGPRGLMPNPKVGTVTMDVARAVNEIKAGKIEYRTDKAGNVQTSIGKVSFTEEQLLENYITLVETLIKVKPSGAKGQYIKSVTLSTTMGPGVTVDVLKASSNK